MQFDPYYWADDVPDIIVGKNYMGDPRIGENYMGDPHIGKNYMGDFNFQKGSHDEDYWKKLREVYGDPPKYEFVTEEQYDDRCRKNALKSFDDFKYNHQSVLVSIDDWKEIVKLVDTLEVNGNIEKLQLIVKKY